MTEQVWLFAFGSLLLCIFGPKKIRLPAFFAFFVFLLVFMYPLFKEVNKNTSVSYDKKGNIILKDTNGQGGTLVFPPTFATKNNQGNSEIIIKDESGLPPSGSNSESNK